MPDHTTQGRRRALSIVVTLCLLALTGCGRGGVPTDAALPAGCGPRSEHAPKTAMIPASTAAADTPLPVWGPDVQAVAAAGSLLFASTFNSPGGHTLFASTDGGASWTPANPPPLPGGWTLTSMALSPDGSTLAGLSDGHLWLGRLDRSAGQVSLSWREAAPFNLFSFAYDPHDAAHLVTVGGTYGPAASATVWSSSDGGRTWTPHPLPIHPGAAWAGIAFWQGSVAVALRVYQSAPAAFLLPDGGAATVLPPPPAAASDVVSGLSDGPDGTLDLVAGGAVFSLAAPAAAWTRVALPSPAADRVEAWLPWQNGIALVTYEGKAPDGESAGWTLWAAPRPSGPWHAAALPGSGIGSPVADGTFLWLPGSLGPLRAEAGGDVSAQAKGLPAPVSVVASAAWRPTTLAAGWSGGLFVSTDGGRSFTAVTPPGQATDDIASLQFSPDGRCLVLLYSQATAFHEQPAAWLSGDLGRTWMPVRGLPGGAQPYSLAEWPAGSGVWWATVSGVHPGVYRSEPGEAVWTSVAIPAVGAVPGTLQAGPDGLWVEAPETGGAAVRVQLAGPTPQPGVVGRLTGWARVAAAAGRNTMQAAAAHAAGRPWEPPMRSQMIWGTGSGPLALDPYDRGTVYAGLHRSLDGGRTWSLITSGPDGWNPVAPPRGYAFDPGSPAAAMAANASVLRDGGAEWTAFWTAAPDQFVTGIAAAGGDGFYVAVQGLGLIVARDAANAFHPVQPAAVPGTWTPRSGAPGVPPLQAAAPSDPQVVYRVVRSNALTVSDDGGKTWGAPLPLALPDGTVCCTPEYPGPQVVPEALLVSPASPSTVYMGLALDEPATQRTAGLWISHDGGRTWGRSTLPAALNVVGLAAGADPHVGAVFAVSTSVVGPSSWALWQSADGGQTWSAASAPGPVFSVGVAPGGQVLAGGADGVLVSGDGGATWRSMPIGLSQWSAHLSGQPGGAGVDAVLEAPNGWLYAGSGVGGLALSRDGGHTWQDIALPIGDPPVQPGGLSLKAGGAVQMQTNEGVFVFLPTPHPTAQG